jgi:predicted NUDIX family phosphoesterase
MNQTQQATQQIPTPHDETILVVKRTHLFASEDAAWQGMRKVDFTQYIDLIQEKKEFLPRSLMETDPRYKQIIPYLVFSADDRYFLMQRKSTASEQRLQNKFTLGIGGHIRETDIGSNSLMDWARREFHEEVAYNDSFTIEPLGILNDDSNAVGQVHIGFVLLLKGTSSNIRIKSELKSGELVSLEECIMHKERLESWSAYVVDYLTRR